MNQAINFFWSILCFFPVMWFWFGADLLMCCIFAAIGILCLFIPSRILQLSTQPKIYERLYVRQIRKLVQNGDLVNRSMRRTQPSHRTIKAKADATGYLSTIMMYEKFHFLCFVFFLLTSVYAVASGKYWWAFLQVLANIIYNICPILLQQYNRARVLKLTKK